MFTGQMPVVGIPAGEVKQDDLFAPVRETLIAGFAIPSQEHSIMNPIQVGAEVIGLAIGTNGRNNPYSTTDGGYRGVVISTCYDNDLIGSQLYHDLIEDGTLDEYDLESDDDDCDILVYHDCEAFWVNHRYFKVLSWEEATQPDPFPPVGAWVRCESTRYGRMTVVASSDDEREIFSVGQTYRVVATDKGDQFDIEIKCSDGEEYWTNMKFFSRVTR